MASGKCQSDKSLEWSTHSGKYEYSATGEIDILLIVPAFPSLDPDVVPRRSRGELTDDEKRKLEHQGVPKDCHRDDLSIMKARYGLDPNNFIVGVESGTSERVLICEEVKKRISKLINKTDKAEGD